MKTKHTMTTLLRQFRDGYTLRQIQIQGQTWHYYDTATGDEALLLMPANGGTAEALFAYIQGFARELRVIVPDIPPQIRTMGEATTGIRQLIDTLKIPRLHLMGLSFGGTMAQIFLRCYPELVDNVILTHTAVPASHIAEVIRMQRAFINLYPAPVLMFLVTRRLHHDLDSATAPADDEERRFWKNYYANHYRTQSGKAQLRSRAHLSQDYYQMPPFQSSDLKTWKGDMLIIESGQDDIISEGDRGALLAQYPRAYVQTLPEMSHLATILASERIINSSLNFLFRDE